MVLSWHGGIGRRKGLKIPRWKHHESSNLFASIKTYKIKSKGEITMNQTEKLALLKERYNRLKDNPKDLKAGGTVRKLKRQIRNMEASM